MASDRNVDAERRQIGAQDGRTRVNGGKKNDISALSDRTDSCGVSECNLGSVNHDIAGLSDHS